MMRYLISGLCALMLVSSFSSTSLAKERRDRDQPSSKIYVTSCDDCRHDRHHQLHTAERQHQRQQKKIARLEQRLDKKQRRIEQQQRKLQRQQQRLAKQHRRQQRLLAERHERHDHTNWPYNHHKQRDRHCAQRIETLLPSTRLVIHFPW